VRGMVEKLMVERHIDRAVPMTGNQQQLIQMAGPAKLKGRFDENK
jgi:hypothetical protein